MVKHERKGKEHLYSSESERKFVEEYGPKKGEEVWGAVVGAVYREQHHGHNWNQGKH